MFSFKFVYGDEIRRISVQNAMSVEELRALAISLFETGIPKDFLFQYRDDEGDNVTISSDRELSEAFRLFHSGAIIRFNVVERKKSKASNHQVEESKEEKTEPVIEKKEGCERPRCMRAHRAVCDQCAFRIRGIRWKCNECPDYDLCDSCLSKNLHSQHQFTKIEMPARNMGRVRPMKLRFFEQKENQKVEEAPKVEPPKVEEKPEEKKPEETKLMKLRFIEPKESPKVEEKAEEKKPEEVKPEEKKVEEKPVEQKQPEKQDHPFESKLKQLEDMGFTERSVNIALLVQYSGDMLAVVRDLLG